MGIRLMLSKDERVLTVGIDVQRILCIFSQLCLKLISIMQWQIPPQPWVIGLDGGISG